jgi:hypothetical protein
MSAFVSGIPGARRKLERALFHAAALRAEVDAFREQSPYDFDMKSLGNPRGQSDFRVLFKVAEAAPPIPADWALITGDILTNTRAALDHAIHKHVRSQDPTLRPWRIQYPIVDAEQDFAQKAAWFSDDVRQLVEDSQPYKADDPSGHPLRILRELVNIDKHRDLVLANYSTDEVTISPGDWFEEVTPPTVYKNVEMVPGATIARAHLRLTKGMQGDQWHQIPCNVVFGETIEIPGIDQPAGLLQAVECVTAKIGEHLDHLEAAGC